jgi:hypothetical protein
MTKDQDLSFQRDPRPEQQDQHRPDQAAGFSHEADRIVESPKLGQARANGYRISYRGDRVGHDRFTVERRWLNPYTNGWYNGRIVYEVEIVAQAF